MLRSPPQSRYPRNASQKKMSAGRLQVTREPSMHPLPTEHNYSQKEVPCRGTQTGMPGAEARISAFGAVTNWSLLS